MIPKGLCKDLAHFKYSFQGWEKPFVGKSENNCELALDLEIWDRMHERPRKCKKFEDCAKLWAKSEIND